VWCEGPMSRSHGGDRYLPTRGSGFDVDRPHGFSSGRSNRETDDLTNR